MPNHPNSSDDPSMDSLGEAFRNLYVQRNGNDDSHNDNGYENGDNGDRTTMDSSSNLPVRPNPNLISRPAIFNFPRRLSQRTLFPSLQPLPGLVNGDQANCPIHENGHIVDLNSDRTLNLLNSFGLLGMMTCEQGLAEFPKLLNRFNEYRLQLVGVEVTSDRRTFLCVATHQYGSSAIRTLLKRSSHVAQLILAAVHDCFIDLMTSKYGRYIVIPTLRAVNKNSRTIIYALVETHALQLAGHEIGCIALNELLNEVRGDYRNRTLDLISNNALWLAQDQYGNFVVQHVLSLQHPTFTKKIGRLLYGNYVHLSCQRLGSHVVEKCLNSMWGMEYVLEELIQSHELVRLAKHGFGNYVVQCALKTTWERSPVLYEQLVNKLRPHFSNLQRGFGRNTLNRIATLAQQVGGQYQL